MEKKKLSLNFNFYPYYLLIQFGTKILHCDVDEALKLPNYLKSDS